jgi:uncharacterized iron-regulated membrane protein
MAMKEGFRQSMAWLHTWSGLLVCWVLFLIFVGGTCSYYRDEITFWMKPELHGAAEAKTSAADAADQAVRTLQERAPNAVRWIIDVPTERHPVIGLSWINPPPKAEDGQARRERRRMQTAYLDPASGEEIAKPRETRGGEFLYRLHFDLHYMSPLVGRWIVGICAMFMLVAIISGVITHKRIFADLFTFRPKKGQRSWLDAHNVTAVLALPFHLMITYTGLVTLMFMYMPAPAKAMYGDDTKTFITEVFPDPAQNARPSGTKAPLAELAPMVRHAQHMWEGEHPGRILIQNPGDAAATVSIMQRPGRQLSNFEPTLIYGGATGKFTGDEGGVSKASETRRAFYGLHLAHFASPFLRALFFLCGLAGCAMVATGALLWAVKTRQQHAKEAAKGKGRTGFGLRLVDGLNIGVIAGLPIALATYFWANRLIPVELANRPNAEVTAFFAAWGMAFAIAHIAPNWTMWRLQLSMAALMFGGIPVLNTLTAHSYHGLALIGIDGVDIVAAFDLVVLLLGTMFGYAAWAMARDKKPAKGAAKVSAKAPAGNT